jgi:hypothetical protein
MISLRAVRGITLAVCAAGIAGMIVTSVQGHNGAAITFGLITAVAILCSMVATAVAADTTRRVGDRDTAADAVASPQVESLAAMVEDNVQRMVAAGVDEDAVRVLVGESVRLGRALGATLGPASP